MFILLANKNAFDSTSINQIQKLNNIQTLVLDGGKQVPVTDLERDWILRVCGELVHATTDLAFNIKAIVASDDQGDSVLFTLRNGFTFVVTQAQADALGAICAPNGHLFLDLEARAAELVGYGVSKDDYNKLG